MSILYPNVAQICNSDGPIVGAKLYFFVAGSTVPKVVYNDHLFESVASQPLIADANGIFPEFFVDTGMYKIQMFDSFDNLIATRDYISLNENSSSTSADSYQIKINADDNAPDYIFNKLQDSSTISWTTSDNKLIANATIDNIDSYKVKSTSSDTPDYLGNKITDSDTIYLSLSGNKIKADYIGPKTVGVSYTDNYPDYLFNKFKDSDTVIWEKTEGIYEQIKANIVNADTYKVKATSADTTPDYLTNKIQNTSSISLSISGNKLIANSIGPKYVEVSPFDDNPSYLQEKFVDSSSINWQTDGYTLSAIATNEGKTKIDISDTLGYISDKIKAGSGIVFTSAEDINGKQIRISTTNSTNSGQVKTTVNDTLGYLSTKLVAGSGITLSANNNQIQISTSSAPAAQLAYISSVLPFTSAIRVVNTSVTAITSITISAGTWDVEGNVLGYISPVTSSVTVPGINSNIATSVAFVNDGYEGYASHTITTGATRSTPLTRRRITVGTNTTLYLVSQARFGEFIYCDFWGNITAKQVS